MLVEMQWISQEIHYVVKQSQKDKARRKDRHLTAVSWGDSISSL